MIELKMNRKTLYEQYACKKGFKFAIASPGNPVDHAGVFGNSKIYVDNSLQDNEVIKL